MRMMRIGLNKKWLIKASRELGIKKVRLKTRIIRFQKADEGQGWDWGYIIDHMTKILHKSYDHDIKQVTWQLYYTDYMILIL